MHFVLKFASTNITKKQKFCLIILKLDTVLIHLPRHVVQDFYLNPLDKHKNSFFIK